MAAKRGKSKVTPQQKARRSEQRKTLSKLKDLGLYKGKVGRSGPVSSYQREVLRTFSEVIQGTARGVKVDRKAEKVIREAGGNVRHQRVVVAAEKGERIRYSAKRGVVEGRKYQYGNYVLRRIFFQKQFDPKQLPRASKKQTFFYRVNFGKGQTSRWESLDEFISHMNTYKEAHSPNEKIREKFRRYWSSHVEVEQIVGRTATWLDDEDGEE